MRTARPNPQSSLQEEFNRWAEAGRGEGMEQDHLPITLPVLEKMRLSESDSVLDVGCGTGWLSRRLATLVPKGRVVGLDLSDQMIRRARQFGPRLPHLEFLEGEVGRIPSPSGAFSRVISVESSYYWPDPEAGLGEIHRVLGPGGSAWILINYYRDNPHCHAWGELLAVPTRLLGSSQWADLFRQARFASVAEERIPDPSPSPATYSGRWFRDAAQLRAFKSEGALLVSGTKPGPTESS